MSHTADQIPTVHYEPYTHYAPIGFKYLDLLKLRRPVTFPKHVYCDSLKFKKLRNKKTTR